MSEIELALTAAILLCLFIGIGLMSARRKRLQAAKRATITHLVVAGTHKQYTEYVLATFKNGEKTKFVNNAIDMRGYTPNNSTLHWVGTYNTLQDIDDIMLTANAYSRNPRPPVYDHRYNLTQHPRHTSSR